jgi:8-oxo-dGTP pyrophosphatase MutT (NUDIX family)
MAGLVLSCGTLVLDRDRELLLGHASGSARWDIPKGLSETGESPRETARRETAEETGLVLASDSLLDLGRHPYLRAKDLHLFAVLIERVDPARCTCSTHFRDARNRLRPEVDAHAWVPFPAVPSRCGKGLAALLAQRISLEAVLADLLERERRHGAAAWHWAGE